MTATIKVLHEMKKLTKEGKPYKVILCLITIGGHESIRKFYIFE